MIITLTGKNSFALSQKLKKIKLDWAKQAPADSVETYEAGAIGDPDSFLLDLKTQNLFSPKRLVILKYVSENKLLAESLEQSLDQIPDDIWLVIFDPALDLRTKLAKALKSKTKWYDERELDSIALKKWLAEEIKSRKLDITASLQAYLIDRTRGSQMQLMQELHKLSGHEGVIDAKVIDALVPPTLEDNIFFFLDAFVRGHKERALQLLAEFENSKMDAHYVFNMIVWQLNIVTLSLSSDKSPNEIAREAGVSPGPVARARGLKPFVSPTKLGQLLKLTAEIDEKIRLNNGWRLLETLVLNVS